MARLSAKAAKRHIRRIAPCFGDDVLYRPRFPDGCDSICVVKYTASGENVNGEVHFDIIYLVWMEPTVKLYHLLLRSSEDTGNPIRIKAVNIDQNGYLHVEFKDCLPWVGSPWSEDMRLSLIVKPDLGFTIP